MKYTRGIGILMMWAVLFTGCSEILEEDISEEAPVLIGPAEGNIEYGTLTFWWTEVEGATQYNLQIISPSFDSAQRLYLDTVVTDSKFNYTPAVGKYQWRVQAQNSAYSSLFTAPRNLNIQEGTDLGRVEVVLKAPLNAFAANTGDIDFSWELIPIATSYRFQIFSGTTALVDETTTTGSYAHTFDEEEDYSWRVTAMNDSSQSVSDSRSLTIDWTVPGAPQLASPSDNANVDFGSDVSLSWTRASTDVVADSLYIYHKNSGKPVSGFSPRRISGTSFELSNSGFIFKKDSSYRWSVVSVDRATNRSEASERIFKVSVQ